MSTEAEGSERHAPSNHTDYVGRSALLCMIAGYFSKLLTYIIQTKALSSC